MSGTRRPAAGSPRPRVGSTKARAGSAGIVRVDRADWLLTAAERGNPDTSVDAHHPDGRAWSTGNAVTPLVHGATYFDALLAAVRATRRGDLVLFTDWRGDPDEALDDAGTTVSAALCEAAERGVVVKGLVWRSHLDIMRFSAEENRRLGEDIESAGGELLLDMRVLPWGSHHQKLVVVRYRGDHGEDVAFVGGIDLGHSRRDDAAHRGDPQPQDMPDTYGDRPPWHDAQLAVRGPAVGDLERTFRERWTDPHKLTRNPIRLLASLMEHDDLKADPIPPQSPDPAPVGDHVVQVLRTYPYRHPPYPFARRGERSIARAYAKALANAESLVYLEDQYLWSTEVAQVFADALRRGPRLLLVAVIPMHPDTTGLTAAGELLGRESAMNLLREAGGDRVAVYGVENPAGTPVYVHAKVCVVDDVWSCVGSDNLNIRSWTHDSELSCAVMDADGGTAFGRSLRLRLNREHLDRAEGDDADLHDAAGLFDAYRRSALALDGWHAAPADGPRPPGRLRAYQPPRLAGWRRIAAAPLYQLVCDPDGRPPALRRRRQF